MEYQCFACVSVTREIIWKIFFFPLGYVWFSKNLKENARERKYKWKVEGKKKWRKIKE